MQIITATRKYKWETTSSYIKNPNHPLLPKNQVKVNYQQETFEALLVYNI